MEKNTQLESAFPYQVQGPTTGPEISCGMALRDYFAAKAMQSIAAYQLENDSVDKTVAAMASYDLADAMLKAREGK